MALLHIVLLAALAVCDVVNFSQKDIITSFNAANYQNQPAFSLDGDALLIQDQFNDSSVDFAQFLGQLVAADTSRDGKISLDEWAHLLQSSTPGDVVDQVSQYLINLAAIACGSLNCQNGGLCLPHANPHCMCSEDFSGLLCEFPFQCNVSNSQLCLNGGICSQGLTRNPTLFLCDCLDGFSGNRCENSSTYCLDSSCFPTTNCHVNESEILAPTASSDRLCASKDQQTSTTTTMTSTSTTVASTTTSSTYSFANPHTSSPETISSPTTRSVLQRSRVLASSSTTTISCSSILCPNITCHWPSVCIDSLCYYGPIIDDGTPCDFNEDRGACFQGNCMPILTQNENFPSCDGLQCPPTGICQAIGNCSEGLCLPSELSVDGKPCGRAGICFNGSCIDIGYQPSQCFKSSCSDILQCRHQGICLNGMCYSGSDYPDGTLCTPTAGATGFCLQGQCFNFTVDLCDPNPCSNGICQQSSDVDYFCSCFLYYEGDLCQNLLPDPDWNDPVLSNPEGVTTNLSLLSSQVVGSFTNPWSLCPQQACRFLYQNSYCDQLCNTANCFFDGNDCIAELSNAEHCTEVFGNGICNLYCNTSIDSWDGGDCILNDTDAENDLVFHIAFEATSDQILLDILNITDYLITTLNLAVTFVNVSNFVSQNESDDLSFPTFSSAAFSLESLCSFRCFESLILTESFLNAEVTADNRFGVPYRAVGAYNWLPNRAKSHITTVSLVTVLIVSVMSLVVVVIISSAMIKRKRRNQLRKPVDAQSYGSSDSLSSQNYVENDGRLDSLLNVGKLVKLSGDDVSVCSILDEMSPSDTGLDSETISKASSPSNNKFSDCEVVVAADFAALKEQDQSWDHVEQLQFIMDGVIQETHTNHVNKFAWLPIEEEFDWTQQYEAFLAEGSSQPPSEWTTDSLRYELSPASITTAEPQSVSECSEIADISSNLEPRVPRSEHNIEDQDQFGNTSFILAAARGDLSLLRRLMQLSPNVQHTNDKGDSALHVGCRSGSVYVVEFLVACGCRLNQRNAKGLTCLHEAIIARNSLIVDALLAFKADPNVPDFRSCTPLVSAIKLGHFCLASRLLEAGASASVLDDKRWTALHWACAVGASVLMTRLMEASENVNTRGSKGETPLHLAAREGSIECVSALLQHSAKRAEIDDFGKTPAQYASERGFQTITQLIEQPNPILTVGSPARNQVSPHPKPPIYRTIAAALPGMRAKLPLIVNQTESKKLAPQPLRKIAVASLPPVKPNSSGVLPVSSSPPKTIHEPNTSYC